MPELTVVVSLLVAGFVLFIWWRRRDEVLYGLFGLAAVLWAHPHHDLRDRCAAAWSRGSWWRLLYQSATGGFVVVMALFTLRYAGIRRPWLERALLAYWLIGPLWLALQRLAAPSRWWRACGWAA